MNGFLLKEACTKIGSGATPRGGRNVYLDTGGTSLIRSQNVYNDHFERNGIVYIGKKHANQLSNVEVQKNDVLLNITGNVARSCQVPEDVLPARVSQHVAIIRPNPECLDPRFLRFYLVSPQMQSLMLSLAAAVATRNALTKGMIENFKIPEVDINEQRQIGSFLGALEDKIDLNRRTNETLESMARAIFKDWFVDFGPTRAKAEGQAPYLAPEIWELFPDALDDEYKPVGWILQPFVTLLDSSIGGDWGKKSPDEKHTEHVSIIRGTDFTTIKSGVSEKFPQRFVEEKKLEKRRLDDGDIVIEVSGGSPKQPTGRSIYLSAKALERFEKPVVPASFCRRFRPSEQSVGVLLACHLDYLYLAGDTWAYQNQSTGIANFQTTFFLENEQVVVPSQAVLEAFRDIASPLIEKTQTNENIALVHLRDLLLPKLMSGEIRLREAEKAVEAVA